MLILLRPFLFIFFFYDVILFATLDGPWKSICSVLCCALGLDTGCAGDFRCAHTLQVIGNVLLTRAMTNKLDRLLISVDHCYCRLTGCSNRGACSALRILLHQTLLVLYDPGPALSNDYQQRQLLNGLVDGSLVAQKRDQNLSFKEHEQQQLVFKHVEFLSSLLLKLLEVIQHAFK